MVFTRTNPSPRYRELVELYRVMHGAGEKFLNQAAEDTFPGVSLQPHVHHIRRLVERTGASSILDYGSGKGMQYDARGVKLATGEVVESIVDYWGVDYVHCYDPSYPKFAALPQGRFDGVISTDVLEHCPQEDLHWILTEMFSFARHFLYANVACYPAVNRLPTGENAHCTIHAPEWWLALFRDVAGDFPGLTWQLSAHLKEQGAAGPYLIEKRFLSDEV
jgi:hypothetical protein